MKGVAEEIHKWVRSTYPNVDACQVRVDPRNGTFEIEIHSDKPVSLEYIGEIARSIILDRQGRGR